MEPIKICIVGGEDVHKRIKLSKYLRDSHFDVTILGTSEKTFPDFINYVPYNLVRSFSFSKDYKTIEFLKRFFKDNEFDVIQTFDTKPAFLVPLALMRTKTPIIRTITGLGTVFMSNTPKFLILRRVYFLIHRFIRKRVSMTVFQNKDDKALFLKHKLITETNSTLIQSSGIELKDISIRAEREGNPFTFICVARLVYEKGIINLIEAARICHDKGYDFKYQIVGPLEENSKRLNEDILKQYDDIVDRLGTRNDVLELLTKADAFILPTFREGFSRVLLEAAAVGLPSITTNVPGVGEIVRDGKEGLIAEVRNSESLANAMIKLGTNKPLADEFAQNALKRVNLFSLETVAKQYISIFTQLINPN
ncbi:glycosyltransferase [Winogradskyella sp. 3972H.M.0a.05]|uniref:glycosyltransferase family 4 protein n=1 Tax=Winogradskyella sp. 3972H.M.0a.05 TaxID=2950277 RepID=UPI0033923484